MNKSELIELMATRADISKSAAGDALEAVLDVVTSTLRKGDSVTLVGFGTFSVSRRAARDGRNPRTGETIKIKASNLAKFKAGKALKDALN
ncbi:MAG: HU family DNA-binding protein [Acidiferrobacterales bacterium]|nr:HU family DNA-binding protein [Acidiferrobacterales bacterium]